MVYSLWKTKSRGGIFRLNTVILTEIKVKSINDVSLPAIASNKLRGDTIRLGAVYICDDANDEILETNFAREWSNHNGFSL